MTQGTSIDDLIAAAYAKNGRDERVTFIAEPSAEELFCPMISADDHLLEPLDLFEHRVPSSLADRVPRVRKDEYGVPWWVVDDKSVPIHITNGASGREMSEWGMQPSKYEEFRRGVWDPAARLKDMDLTGVWASLCFGSVVWGFAGWRFSLMKDSDAGLAAVRAYNDWELDEWCGTDPNRFISCQLPWLRDPEIAANEIRRNAERGFLSVSFSENPEIMGFESLYSGKWDDFFQACADTDTVINLHVGSAGRIHKPSTDSPTDVTVALFPLCGIETVVDWIYARIPVKFPGLKIVLSEAGISWVPMVVERLRRAYRQIEASTSWSATDPDPVEILFRNFFFTSIEDPSAFRALDQMPVENLMVETDFPHKDSTWPHSQEMIRQELEHLPASTIKKICYENASRIYRHPSPPEPMIHHSIVGRRTG